MATIVLGLIGSIFGPIGTAIGIAIGGYIDSKFLFPALFGPDDQNIAGPRIIDLRIMTASAGSGMHYCMGPSNRVGGHIIWKGALIEVEHVTQSGGKGGSSISSTTFEYFIDMALGICEIPIEGTIQKITRVWADGNVIYHDRDDVELDEQMTATRVEVTTPRWIRTWVPASQGVPGHWEWNLIDVVTDAWLELSMQASSDPGIFDDFTDLVLGDECVLDGFGPPNDGTYIIRTIIEDDGGGLVFVELDRPPLPGTFIDQVIGQRQLSQVIPKFDPSKMTGINVHLGSSQQLPDAIIEATEGIGLTPGFRGTSYFVIEQLFLGDFGNRIPRFEVEVEAHLEGYTYQEAIGAIMRRGGIDLSLFDVTAIPDDLLLRGYTSMGPFATNKLLEPLMLAGHLNVKKVNGRLEFYRLEEETKIGVDPAVLGAYEPGKDPPPTLRLHDVSDRELPTEIVLKYVDVNKSLQDGSRDYQFIERLSDSSETFELPITMTSAEAYEIARDILVRLWNERSMGDFVLPASMLGLGEGTEIDATVDGEGFKIRVTEVSRGAENFLHECRGILTEATDISPPGVGDDTDDKDPGGVYAPPFLVLKMAGAPALIDAHNLVPGFYYGMAAKNFTAQWLGGKLFESLTSGGNFGVLDSTAVEAALVTTDSILGIGPISGVRDNNNTVDVTLIHGTLGSISPENLLTGLNRMWLGEELIGYQTVTALPGNHKFRLSILLRGLRNTEDGMIDPETGSNRHVSGEMGIALSEISTRFVALDIAEIGLVKFYKPLAIGGDIANQSEQSFLLRGRTVLPFAPGHLLGSWNTNDLDLRWVRRTRKFYVVFSGAILPQLPAEEQYTLRLLDETTGDVSFIYTDILTPSFTIPAADLASAGYSAQEPPDVRLYQIGDIAGQGVPNEAFPIIIKQV